MLVPEYFLGPSYLQQFALASGPRSQWHYPLQTSLLPACKPTEIRTERNLPLLLLQVNVIALISWTKVLIASTSW